MRSYLEGSRLTKAFRYGGYDLTVREIKRVLYATKAAAVRSAFAKERDPALDVLLKELYAYGIHLELLADHPLDDYGIHPGLQEDMWALAGQCYDYLSEDDASALPPRALLALRSCLCYSRAGLSSNAALVAKKVETSDLGFSIPTALLTYLKRDFVEAERLCSQYLTQSYDSGQMDFKGLLEWYLWRNLLQALQLHIGSLLRAGSDMEQLRSHEIAPRLQRAAVFAERLSSTHYRVVQDLQAILNGLHDRSVRRQLRGVLPDDYLDVLTGASKLPDLPAPVVELWPSQSNAIEGGFLGSDVGHRILSMPTSSGKTLLAELAIIHALQAESETNCIYVVPTRALLRQVERDLGQRLNPLGLTVSSVLGDYEFIDLLDDFILKRARVLVATPERLSALLRRRPTFFSTTRLVIYDEFHKIAEGQRGIIQEETLIAIQSLSDLGLTECPRVLICSAVLSQHDKLQRWLSKGFPLRAVAAVSEWRPTRSLLSVCWHQPSSNWLTGSAVKESKGRKYRLESSAVSTHLSLLFPDLPTPARSPQTVRDILHFKLSRRAYVRGATEEYKASINTSDVAVAVAAALSKLPGVVLVYSPQPDWAVSLARKLSKVLTDAPTPAWTGNVIRSLTHRHPLITQLAPKGIAYHHGKLPDDVREAIEASVAKRELKVLVATSSLLEGVNLPISTLVIAQPYRFVDGRNRLFDLRSFLNLVGRAGRALRETEGMVVLIEDPAKAHTDTRFYRSFIGLDEETISAELEVHSRLEQLITVADEQLLGEENDEIEQMKTMILGFEGMGFMDNAKLAARSLATAYHNHDVTALFNRTSDVVRFKVEDPGRRQLFSYSGLPLRDCIALYDELISNREELINTLSFLRTPEGRIRREAIALLNRLAMRLKSTAPKIVNVDHDKFVERWLRGRDMETLSALFLPQEVSYGDATTDQIEEAVSACIEYMTDYIRYKLPWAISAIVLFMGDLTSEDDDEVALDEDVQYLPSFVKSGVSTRAAAACASLGVRDRLIAQVVGQAYHIQSAQGFSVRHFIQWFNRLDLPQIQRLRLADEEKALLLTAARKYAGKLVRTLSRIHHAYVAGIQYYNPEVISALRRGDRVLLKREPTNAVDPYAVEVYLGPNKLGYIQKDEAPAVASWLSDDLVISTRVAAIKRIGNFNRRVQLELTLVDVAIR